MIKILFLFLCIMPAVCIPVFGESGYQKDVIPTSGGDLTITFIGHGTIMFTFGGKVIHVDPWTRLADYSGLPEADIILVTHEHGDHFDMEAIKKTRTEKTTVIYTERCAQQIEEQPANAIVMNNGDTRTVEGIAIAAVQAYNIRHKRDSGAPFHPKGEGNGYVLAFGDTKVYVAGDTENIPEMAKLGKIDIAFLPMNLPYTMTPEMVADAVRMIKPRILYPYHYGDTDTGRIVELLKGKETEVRIRPMQ